MFKKTVEACIQENDLVSLEQIIISGKECGKRLFVPSLHVKTRWIQYSIEIDSFEVLEYFMKCYVNMSDTKPLYYAAVFNRRKIIDFLLSIGESPEDGLEGAVVSCNLSLCEYFYPLCKRIDWNMLLFDAVETYDRDIIRWCFGKLGNVGRFDCSIFEALCDGSQTTEEVVGMIDFLVEELGVPTKGGLRYIVSEGTLEAVEYFVEKSYASQKDIRRGTRDALINCDTEKVSCLFERLEDGPKFARKIVRRVINFHLPQNRHKFDVEEEDESFVEPDNVIFLLTYLKKDEASQVFFHKVIAKFKKLGRLDYTSQFEENV